MFQNLLQIFNIIFDTQDIALCLKQNYNGSAILDIHIYRRICVTSQPGKNFCMSSRVSGRFHYTSCSFTFFLFQIIEKLSVKFLF